MTLTNYTSSITVDQVIVALTAFVTPFIIGGSTVRGQVNRVPLPTNPCAVLTELLQKDIRIPHTGYDPANEQAIISGPTQIDVQCDIYGSQAGEYCKTIKTAFRSQWGFQNFPCNIKPLFTDDGRQTPLLTGEEQYESRWTLTLSMQYNPVVAVPQDFADELSVAHTYDADL